MLALVTILALEGIRPVSYHRMKKLILGYHSFRETLIFQSYEDQLLIPYDRIDHSSCSGFITFRALILFLRRDHLFQTQLRAMHDRRPLNRLSPLGNHRRPLLY